MKEIEKDTKKQKDTPCLWIGRLNVVKNVQRIYRFKAMPMKMPMAFFTEIF